MPKDPKPRLSPEMKRAMLSEREGRLPLLEAGLKANDLRERRGALRTKMALTDAEKGRGYLRAHPFRCELTEEGIKRLEALRVEEMKRQHRANIKARKEATGPHPRWGTAKAPKRKTTPRWGGKAVKRWMVK